MPETLATMSNPAPRVMMFVDGFNLYHSIERVQKTMPDASLKWLDLTALGTAHLYTISTAATLAGVHYFTAYADHLALTDPEKITRHRTYVRALTATEVVAHFGHFKPKNIWIEALGRYERIWQEKATDIGIVAEVFRQAARDAFDTAVIVSGDADYAPSVPVFHELFPQKRLLFAFPFDRKNKELARAAPDSFTLSRESYARHQFPNAVRLPSGKFVVCPHAWRCPPTASLPESNSVPPSP
jgi:uncharacterized LabA/DUF88 family protein